MKRFTGLKFLALAVVAGAMSSPAWATLEISIGGSVVSNVYTGGTLCVDNNAACDGNSATGTLSTSTAVSVGTASVTGTTSTSGTPMGTLGVAINITASSTGSFTIDITDSGYSNPAPPNLILSETINGNNALGGPSATITSVGTFDPGTALFVTGGAGTTSTAPASTTLGAAQGAGLSTNISTGNPYSLNELITINVTSLGTSNNKQFQVIADLATVSTPVPEPASILLLGSALLVSVTALKRKYGRS
jgi:hypothetical protein